MSVSRRSWEPFVPVLGTGALLALMLLGTAVVATAPAQAAEPESSFYYASEPDNPFGQGTADYIDSDDVDFYSGPSTVYMGGTDWMVGAAGPGGSRLVTGTTYTGARNSPAANAPWLDLSSQRLYGNCYDIDASFTVHDVGYYGTSFSRLSLSFSATCEGNGQLVHGELRYKASAPAFDGVTLSPVNRRSWDAGFAPVGGTGEKKTVTLENVGESAVAVGAASMTGADAGDFEVVDDTCAGVSSLAAGASCTFAVRLAPTTTGELDAVATIPVGTMVGARQIAFRGTGQQVTTTTIEGPTGWQWAPVDLRALVSPSPTTTDGGSSVWFTFPDADPMDGPVGGPEPMMADGSARYQGTLPGGIHRVYAEFNRNGTGTWAPSRSETITLKIMQASGVSLVSSQNPTNSDEPPVITARVTPADVTFDGGTLVVRDVTTDTVLGSLDVAPGSKRLTIEPFLTSGAHLIRAEYSGYEGVEGSSAELTQTIRANAGATMFPNKIYPFVDGYLDTLEIEAWRYHPLKVDITFRSLADDSVVRTQTFPPETDWILWHWDGRDDDGALVAAGQYEAKVSFNDGGSAPKVVKKTITVSRDRVEWRTRSVTLGGAKYSLASKSRNATISKAASPYAGGVRLNSGKGVAAVSYALPVAGADVYGGMTFAVQGRSANGHKGLIAVWDPNAGGYRDVGNYDAAKLVGPGYKWWKTSVPSDGDRVRQGKVRALVLVAKGMGKSGPATFDVRKVKLTYQTGTLVKVAAAALAGDEGPLPAPTSSRVGRSAADVLRVRVPLLRDRAIMPRLPEPTHGAGEAAVVEASAPQQEAVSSEPPASEPPAPIPAPEEPSTVEPTPTIAPDPVSEPGPSASAPEQEADE